tara:strand:+ start:222 stop:452 length:231 start_codon:yes stop_codon:yes gene_type:complete
METQSDYTLEVVLPDAQTNHKEQRYSIFDIADILRVDRTEIAELVYAPELQTIRSGQVDSGRLKGFLISYHDEEPW